MRHTRYHREKRRPKPKKRSGRSSGEGEGREMNSESSCGRMWESSASRGSSVEDLQLPKKSHKKGSVGHVLSRLYFRFWGKRGDRIGRNTFPDPQGSRIKRFSEKEIAKVTGNFRERIGIGGSGRVYKGVLGAVPVAVKRVEIYHDDIPHAESKYASEIAVLGQLDHPNVVKLMGWCHEKRGLFVVYEYIPNGSLERYLHHRDEDQMLPWEVRYSKIAVGLTSALVYLHEEMNLLHRDIKPSNILLDGNFNPKLSDFELARKHDDSMSGAVTTTVAGTLGYMAPEYMLTGNLGKETDIYSFGFVLLQLATGRRANPYRNHKGLPDYVREAHWMGAILETADPGLGDAFDKQQMERLLSVGIMCTSSDPRTRPSISHVRHLLEFEGSVPRSFGSNDESPLPSTMERFLSDLGESQTETVCYDLPISFHTIDGADATAVDSDPRATTTPLPAITEEGTSATIHDYHVDINREPAAAMVPPAQAAFDIGIPPNEGSAAAQGRFPRKDHHHPLVDGVVDSLHRMLQPEDRPPRFDLVLDSVKMYTAFLVKAVGPPLDDWNELAQSVLRVLKEEDDFSKSCADSEPSATSAATTSSLSAEMDQCALAIEEDDAEIGDARESLARAQQECDSLMAKLKEAQDIRLSIEAKVNIVEQRRAHHLARLERKRRLLGILEGFRLVLCKLSSFRSDS